MKAESADALCLHVRVKGLSLFNDGNEDTYCACKHFIVVRDRCAAVVIQPSTPHPFGGEVVSAKSRRPREAVKISRRPTVVGLATSGPSADPCEVPPNPRSRNLAARHRCEPRRSQKSRSSDEVMAVSDHRDWPYR